MTEQKHYYMFMDLETTDKYPTGWNNIIEIAAIIWDVENNVEIDRFNKICCPTSKKISDGASEVTGYTIEFLLRQEPEEDVLLEFAAWSSLHAAQGNIEKIVGHNYLAFDHNVITKRMDMLGMVWPFAEKKDMIIDTMRMAKGVKKYKIPCLIADTGSYTPTGKVQYTQEAIAKFYNIDYNAHKAINDIECLIKIYQNMVGTNAEDNKKARRESAGF